jgi:hypothetical protein
VIELSPDHPEAHEALAEICAVIRSRGTGNETGKVPSDVEISPVQRTEAQRAATDSDDVQSPNKAASCETIASHGSLVDQLCKQQEEQETSSLVDEASGMATHRSCKDAVTQSLLVQQDTPKVVTWAQASTDHEETHSSTRADKCAERRKSSNTAAFEELFSGLSASPRHNQPLGRKSQSQTQDEPESTQDGQHSRYEELSSMLSASNVRDQHRDAMIHLKREVESLGKQQISRDGAPAASQNQPLVVSEANNLLQAFDSRDHQGIAAGPILRMPPKFDGKNLLGEHYAHDKNNTIVPRWRAFGEEKRKRRKEKLMRRDIYDESSSMCGLLWASDGSRREPAVAS